MKRLEKSIAALLAAMLLFTSMGVGVFAETDAFEPENGITEQDVLSNEDTLEAAKDGQAEDPIEQLFECGRSLNGKIISESNTLKLTWEAVENAERYVVDLKGTTGMDESNHQLVVESGENAVFNDLVVGEEYNYSIKVELVKLQAVTNLKAVRGYKTIKFTWSPVKGAAGYKVYSSTSQTMPSSPLTYDNNERDTQFILKNLSSNVTYNVWVVPYRDRNDKSTYGTPAKVSAAKVHGLYYSVTLKKTRTLKCHCGKHKARKRTFKKGFQFRAYAFSGGCYWFMYNGHKYRVSALSCKNAKSLENANDVYSKEEAEYYINEYRPTSKTPYVVWASLYTQHVYVFKKSRGQYKMVKCVLCGTGKASTPTPTGMKRSIYFRKKKRHGRPYWNCFLSYTAIHGLKKEKLRGRTLSNGCIRVNNNDAKYIYYTVPLKSRMMIY